MLEFPGQHLFLVVQQNLLRNVIRTKLKYISLFNTPEFSKLSSTLAKAVSSRGTEATSLAEVKLTLVLTWWWEFLLT